MSRGEKSEQSATDEQQRPSDDYGRLARTRTHSDFAATIRTKLVSLLEIDRALSTGWTGNRNEHLARANSGETNRMTELKEITEITK